MYLKLSDLKNLCEKMEKEGYEDSLLRVSDGTMYHAIEEIKLIPNEFGEVVVELHL